MHLTEKINLAAAELKLTSQVLRTAVGKWGWMILNKSDDPQSLNWKIKFQVPGLSKHPTPENVNETTNSRSKYPLIDKKVSAMPWPNLSKAVLLEILPLDSSTEIEGGVVDQIGTMLRQIEHNEIEIQPHNTAQNTHERSQNTEEK